MIVPAINLDFELLSIISGSIIITDVITPLPCLRIVGTKLRIHLFILSVVKLAWVSVVQFLIE